LHLIRALRQSRRMELGVRGHPLHTRSLSVTLAQREDGRLDVFGEVLDLRKRGFVPVAGDLQSSGIVHQMQLRAVVAPESARLESLAAAQPAVAFEPSALTQGESCRDPIGRIQALVGAPLDRGFAKRWLAEIGGPLGCSHILTLGQLLASTVAWALERERACAPGPRRVGERIFRRDLVIDGCAVPGGDLELALQLTDLHFAPSPALARPIERLGEQLELRALVLVAMRGMTLARIEAAERRRTRAELASASWRDHGAALAPLVGQKLASGVGGALVRRFGDEPDLRPLLDLLLNLTPAAHQCMAAFSENWPALALQNPSQIGMGGIPDSCFMWRRGGALDRAREEERRGGTPPLLPS
jgi:Protein of unknown function (DUF2889)